MNVYGSIRAVRPLTVAPVEVHAWLTCTPTVLRSTVHTNVSGPFGSDAMYENVAGVESSLGSAGTMIDVNVGECVSMVQLNAFVVVLPTGSDAVTENVWTPSGF